MMVRLQNLSKRFGRRMAVEDISLAIEEREIFGLLGHNGAGKSTTFGMMLGMVAPDRGEVSIGGHSVQSARPRALERTGAIFETPAFYEYLSGWDNLRFFVSLSGQHVPRARLEEAVAWVGLEGRIRDRVGEYSHGMRQRLGLAQALVPEPSFLLLDEPTDGLDPLGILEMREMICRLRDERGITVMLSSHLLSEVERLCDRVAILHQGRMLFEGVWQSPPVLWRFVVEPAGQGSAILQECGLTERSPQDGRGSLWEAEIAGEFDPAPVVERLVKAGVAVREVTPERVTLEDFYRETVTG